jgi:hypothetical protein
MSTFRIARSLAALGVALGVSLAAGSAGAETKVYMGSQCHPTDYFDGSRLSAGYVTNEIKASANDIKVACPIVKGVISNSEIASVSVTMYLATARRVTCDLYAMRGYIQDTSTTNQIAHVQNSQTTTYPAGTTVITLPTMTAGGGTAWPADDKFKYYEMFCTLNNGDRIRSYQVNETGTDSQYTRIYPNSMCRFGHAPSGLDSRYSVVRGADKGPGGYFQAVGYDGRANGGEFEVFCPIIGDHGTGNGGTKRVRVAMTKPDVPGVQNNCTVYQRYSYGLPVASYAKSLTGDGNEFPSFIQDFTLPDAGVARQWSRYHLRCTAPGNADTRILGYAVEEK